MAILAQHTCCRLLQIASPNDKQLLPSDVFSSLLPISSTACLPYRELNALGPFGGGLQGGHTGKSSGSSSTLAAQPTSHTGRLKPSILFGVPAGTLQDRAQGNTAASSRLNAVPAYTGSFMPPELSHKWANHSLSHPPPCHMLNPAMLPWIASSNAVSSMQHLFECRYRSSRASSPVRALLCSRNLTVQGASC